LLPSDAQGIFDLDTDPEVMKFLGGVTMTSMEKAQEVVDNIIWQYEEFGTGRLAIIDKNTEEFIGWTGIKRERQLRDFIYYDLGYRLKSKYWGQGIATETANFSLKYGFQTLKLDKICGATSKTHTASQKVLLKSGLQFAGTFNYENEECNWYEIQKDHWINLNKNSGL
jgi:ribosomal-protein-alanine N-acetyltransferase